MILMDVFISGYESRSDAPEFAKFITDMVAALDPEELEGWNYWADSPALLSRELSSLAEAWELLTKQPPPAPQQK